jgi:hypothetical protein
MITELSDLVITVLVTLGALILLFIAWNLIVRRRRELQFHTPASLDDVSEAKIEGSEFRASLISEEIEERVKKILQEEGSSLAEEIDFGTASDGSLRIWYKDQAYSSPDEIPDEVIRTAVAQAVKDFNQ